ncbi:MAG: HMA2 domain-containing protein [Alphaproteobacteria bacterium]
MAMTPGSAAAPDAGVVPIHVAVSGRVRLKVAGLDRNAGFAQTLERLLPGRSGIHAVTANVRTGNLLVHFDPERSVDGIIEAVTALLSAAPDMPDAKEMAPATNVVPFPEMFPGKMRDSGGLPEADPLNAPPHILTRKQVLQRLETTPENGLCFRHRGVWWRGVRFQPGEVAVDHLICTVGRCEGMACDWYGVLQQRLDHRRRFLQLAGTGQFGGLGHAACKVGVHAMLS